jgi:aryl-alcohol dehydrogenase-like predicted oxidoreductase
MYDVSLGGLTVSAQGLGCMGMSEYYGQADWDVSVATVRHAFERGITLFDTADIYGAGHNEVLLGRALHGYRNEVVVATKFGVDRTSGDDRRTVRGDEAYVRRSCDASLLRLGTDRIDLYYLHRPPQNVPIEETIGAMASLIDEGKVRHLGVCEVADEQLRRAEAVHHITAVQSEYSLWSRDVEGLAPTLRELDVALVAYSPLGRGFLTGAVDPNTLSATDSRQHHPRFQGQNASVNADLVARVSTIAKRLGATPAQVALAWVHHRSSGLGVPVVPIPGTRRSARVDENLAALDVVLDAAALDELEPLAALVAGSRNGAMQATKSSPSPATRT